MAFDTGCSSFSTALSVAASMLSNKQIKMAIVGAANIILNESTTNALQNAGMLSQNYRCASFDADADGYVRGEGAAVFILERVPENEAQNSCQLIGWSVAHNGDSMALTAPNANSYFNVMKSAIQGYEDRIDLFECHGSATALGDPIEIRAVTELAKDNPLWITSVKTHLGHCEAAAGAASLIYVLHMMKHQYLPAIKHFKCLNPRFEHSERLRLPVIGMEQKIDLVAINSFGFSGTNTCTLVKNAEKYEMHSKGYEDSSHVLVLSAKSMDSLARMVRNLQNYVERTDKTLQDIVTTLQLGRKHYEYR